MKVGYIGLGAMGFPCALNLMKAGFELRVWARKPEVASAIAGNGAILCQSPAELAAAVDIIFTNLPNAPEVSEVMFAANGIAKGARKGLIVVDMSTISALATREIAAKARASGIEFVDAPVSGGVAGAQNAKLTILVGASEPIFERIKPVLSAMGSVVTLMGGTGAGQFTKSCNQIMMAGMVVAVAEAVKFARQAGLDPAAVRNALLTGSARSNALELHGKRMVESNFTPAGFKNRLQLKDMEIVESIASAMGFELPMTSTATAAIRRAVDAGHGDKDNSVVVEVV